MKTFENYCTCGGFAWQMNGRPEAQPHMDWCPQRAEYAEWYAEQKRPAVSRPELCPAEKTGESQS